MAKGKKVFQRWFPVSVILLLLSMLLTGCSNNAVTSSPEPPPPSAPTSVAAQVQGDGSTITVTWGGVSGASSYTVYWSKTTGVTASNLTALPNAGSPCTFKVPALPAGSPPPVYYVLVTAVGPYGESAPSPQVAATSSAAPTGVAVAPGNGQATITWTGVQNATSYNLYYSQDSFSTANGAVNATEIPNVSSPYLQANLVNAKTYYFVVTAVVGGIESAASTEVSTLPAVVQPPSPPTGVVATAAGGQVAVDWQPVPGATSYNLYWSTSPGVTPANTTNILSPTAPGAVIPGLINGTTYYVVVTAVTSGVESLPSTVVSAKPFVLPLPATPSATALPPGNGQATISWTTVTGATSYTIYWSTTSGVTPENGAAIPGVPGTSTSYLVEGLNNGITYYFVVTALDSNGESLASNQVSAIPVL